MSKSKRQQRRPEPESTPGIPIIQCVGCATEGRRVWGLHVFVAEGQRVPVCFRHLHLGRQDAAKAEINEMVAALMPERRESPSLLLQLERVFGIAPRVAG